MPLYDGDLEAEEGLPDAVVGLKAAVAAADGLLLVTPEYNNGIPGVFKNAVDWMSRPPADIPAVFGGKPVGLIGASPGGFGTVLSQTAWLPVLRTLGCELWSGGRLMVSRAGAASTPRGGWPGRRCGGSSRGISRGSRGSWSTGVEADGLAARSVAQCDPRLAHCFDCIMLPALG